MPKPFIKISTEDSDLNRVQDHIDDALSKVSKNLFNDAILLQNVNLIVGITNVNHGLGHDLVGWIVTRKNAVADIYDIQNMNLLADKTLQLVSSAVCRVDLLVY